MIPGSAVPLLLAKSDDDYKIDRSLRFNSADSAYLSRTPSSAGNRKTWTWSGWLKRTGTGNHCIFSAQGSSNHTLFMFYSSTQKFAIIPQAGQAGATFQSNDLYRDPSAWYHFVIAFDSTQSTASNRLKVYKNGVEITWSSSTYPSQNEEWNINIAGAHNIGRTTQGDSYVDGYLTEIYFIDGQALAATDFGEYDDNNVWQPKEFTGSHNAPAVGQIYSGMLTSSNGFQNNRAATRAFDGDITTNATSNLSNDNYLEFTPTTPISFTNGVHVNAYAANGYSITNYWSIDLDGNGLGSETTFVGGGSNFNGFAWIQVATGSGTLHKLRIRLTRSGSTSSAGIRAIAINGTATSDYLVDGTLAGVNGFYLKFADNSSNAALGTDSSGNNNTWTVNNLTAEQPETFTGVFLNNTSDFLSIASSSDFAYGTGDFTWEMYVYFIQGGYILDHGSNGGTITGGANGVAQYYNSTTAFGSLYSTGFGTMPANTWTHLAAVRHNGTTYLYTNGVLSASAADSHNYGAQSVRIGQYGGGGNNFLGGVVSNLRIVKGTAVYTSNFTRPTAPLANITNTVLLCCQSSSSATAATVSPGTITATSSPYPVTLTDSTEANDSLIDTPTNYDDGANVGGNYATLNPLHNGQTLSNGNLDVVGTSSWKRSVSTIAMSSGKYYWEYKITASNEHIIGVGPLDMQMSGNLGAGNPPGSGYGTELGQVNGTGANGSWSNTGGSTTGDLIGVAFDADAGNMYIYKNGTALNSGTASHTGLTDGPYYAVFSLNGSSRSGCVNFGQRPFAYTPPTGYVSLCTTNLPDPTIADGSTAFDTKLWTGNGGTQTISGLNLSPDFVWYKSRSSGVYNHGLFDIVRGTSKQLFSNNNSAEGTYSGVTSFNSDGFTLGADAGGNYSGGSYVGWIWDAGTSTVSNTDGSITSSVRANPTAGISIVSYTGTGSSATVGHSLNTAPAIYIIKSRNSSADWQVSTTVIDGSHDYLALNTTAAKNNSGRAAPTSSVFSIGSGTVLNASGVGYIAYCFAPVNQFSSFGSYVGNGSADGPFVSLSFAPKWVMVKGTGSSTGWRIWDSEREPDNPKNNSLHADVTQTETYYGADDVDFLSNGFKLRATGSYQNSNNTTYIYLAFASHPFKTARAR